MAGIIILVASSPFAKLLADLNLMVWYRITTHVCIYMYVCKAAKFSSYNSTLWYNMIPQVYIEVAIPVWATKGQQVS